MHHHMLKVISSEPLILEERPTKQARLERQAVEIRSHETASNTRQITQAIQPGGLQPKERDTKEGGMARYSSCLCKIIYADSSKPP